MIFYRFIFKAQLILGLLFLVFAANAQTDTVFWKNYKEQRYVVYDLMSQNLDSAWILSEQLFATTIQPLDTKEYTGLLLTQGHILADLGRLDEANKKYLEAVKLKELLGDKSIVSSAYHSMANMHYYLQEYSTSREYIQKAIKGYSLNPEFFRKIANCYNFLGVTYYDEGVYDSALYYFKIGVDTLNKHEESLPEDYSYLYDNLGNTLIWQEKFEEGFTYLRRSISIYKKNNNLNNLIWSYEQMVSAHLLLENYDSSKHYLNLIDSIPKVALTLEKSNDLFYFKLLTAANLREYDSLVSFVNQFYEFSDSLVTVKTNANIKDAQTKYETEKKEIALKLSEEEKDKLSAENKAKTRLLLLGLAILIIITVLSLYFYRNFKQKEKLNALEVEVKNAELEELLSNQEAQSFESILKGQEKERERIAQDLHDRLGGTLAALKLAMRKPENKVQENDLAIIDNAVNEVRSIAHNLSTGWVHKYGLNEAVNQLFRTLENSKGIKFTLYLHQDIGSLGQTVGIELYRIVQELVSNTIKHANASDVSLQTNFIEGVFNMIYEDNGVGFNPNKMKGGIGLENIKSRIAKIGGELNIDAALRRGSIFIVELKASQDR